MQLETGKIVKGKIVKITKFGVFVELEPKINGLVHISEISKHFVVDISNFLNLGEIVNVKILNNKNGKINLSIKQAQELKPRQTNNLYEAQKLKKNSNSNPAIFKIIENQSNLSFEEKLSRFKKNSEEKLSDIKQRNPDNRRSSYSKRR